MKIFNSIVRAKNVKYNPINLIHNNNNRNWISNKKFLLRDFRETLEWTVHKFLPSNWLLNEQPLSFKFQFSFSSRCDAFVCRRKNMKFFSSFQFLYYYCIWLLFFVRLRLQAVCGDFTCKEWNWSFFSCELRGSWKERKLKFFGGNEICWEVEAFIEFC